MVFSKGLGEKMNNNGFKGHACEKPDIHLEFGVGELLRRKWRRTQSPSTISPEGDDDLAYKTVVDGLLWRWTRRR